MSGAIARQPATPECVWMKRVGICWVWPLFAAVTQRGQAPRPLLGYAPEER